MRALTLIGFLLLLLGTWDRASGQNLVQNGGFEKWNGCPYGTQGVDQLVNWVNLTAVTPDHWHQCDDLYNPPSPRLDQGCGAIITYWGPPFSLSTIGNI